MESTRNDLIARYADMDLQQLQAAAGTRDQLTDEARHLLLQEIALRRAEPNPVQEIEEEELPEELVWVTVDRFRDLSSAIVARGALEAAEIPCFLRDENTVRLDWQISNFIGGMRLQVPEQELEAAQQVLTGLAIDEEPASDTGTPPPEECCPRCGSAGIHRKDRRRGVAFAALWLFTIPIPKGTPEWRCERCGFRWTDKNEA